MSRVTLARLAGRLGVRPPSLYNHVRGLDDLRRGLTLRAVEMLGDALRDAAVGRAGDEAIIAIAQTYRRFAHEHPGLYATTLRSVHVGKDADLRAAGDAVIKTVVAILRAYGLEGDEAMHATRIVRSAVHGFVALETVGGFGIPIDIDETFDRYLSLITDGLRNWPNGGKGP